MKPIDPDQVKAQINFFRAAAIQPAPTTTEVKAMTDIAAVNTNQLSPDADPSGQFLCNSCGRLCADVDVYQATFLVCDHCKTIQPFRSGFCDLTAEESAPAIKALEGYTFIK